MRKSLFFAALIVYLSVAVSAIAVAQLTDLVDRTSVFPDDVVKIGLPDDDDSDDEGDDEDSDQDPGGIVPTFATEEIPPSVTERFVLLQSSSVDGDRIVLDVVVTEVNEPVSGVVLKLGYPAEFSAFIGCTDGDLFPPGACFFAEPGPGSGEVFVARTVTDVAQATPAAGDQVVLRIEFLVFGVGMGPIVIEGQNLGGSDVSALLDVNGDPIFVQWFAGTLTGQRFTPGIAASH